MLPENESPIRPEDQPEIEDQLDETPPVEQEAVVEESGTEEAPVAEETIAEVESSENEAAEESPESPVAEVEEELVATEEISAGEGETESVAAAEEPVVEESGSEETNAREEEVSTAENEQVEEVVTEQGTTEDVEAEEEAPSLIPQPEVSDALLARIDEILGTEESTDLLTDASAVELIHALDFFILQDDTRAQIPRVGLVKRSFDALRAEGGLPDEVLDAFRISLANFNRKRSEVQKQADAAKVENSARKKELLEKLRSVVESEDALRIKEVRAIQDEWKTIGHVLKADIEPLYKNYRYLLDKFYKLREMHFEMLDYDRKINLAEKERLIEEAGKLIPPEEDRNNTDVWKEKMDLLTELQHQWKAVGHVPREDMERINNSYREAIDQFFEIRQGFMKELDAEKEENARKKEEILEKMARFKDFNAEKPRLWNESTQELRGYQEEWKAIGQAPYTKNNELWNRYREICNAFFSRKAEFFRKFDEVRNANLELKRALVEKAEALKDSTDFDKTSKELKGLQREWKQIGPVPGRYSNKLWNRFRAACDAFFENRRGHYQGMHADENANLELKKQVIEKAKQLKPDNFEDPGKAVEAVKALQADWKGIGKVPFKQKDTIWEEFRAAIDNFFDQLSVKRGELKELKLRAQLSMSARNNDGGENRQLKGKIFKMRKRIQAVESKIEQYSTNIQYISKGKSGDALRAQIQKEIDKEKRLVEDLKGQLKVMNDVLRNPPKPEEKPAEEPKAETPVEQAETVAEEKTVEAPASEEKPEAETPPATEENVTPEQEETPAAEGIEEEASAKEEVEAEEKAPEDEVTEDVPATEEPTVEALPEAEAPAPESEPVAEESDEEKSE